MKAQRIMSLIKKAYDQPLLFHKLHCHRTHTLGMTNPLLEMSDEWSRILVYSSIRSKHPNQDLEVKMLGLLKKIRSPIEKGERLKLWIILYYMKNRSPEQMNDLILFELVSNFMGISLFADGLVLSIFSSAILWQVFGLSVNKR